MVTMKEARIPLNEEREKYRRILIGWMLFPVAVIILLVGRNLSDWRNADRLTRELAENQCHNVATQMAVQLNNVFHEKSNDLAVLTTIWQYCPPEDRERQFLREARNKLIQTPSFQAIDHMDERGRVLFSTHPERKRDPSEPRLAQIQSLLQQIRYFGNPVCDSAIPQEDGTLEVDFYFPILLKGEDTTSFLGSITATLSIQDLLKTIIRLFDENEFYIRSDINGIRVQFDSEKEPSYYETIKRSSRLDVYGNEWAIEIFLRPSSQLSHLFQENFTRFLFNLSISLFITGLLVLLIVFVERLRKNRQILHQSEFRFRQLAEIIQEVFWLYDVKLDQMIYISPAYERIWGRSVESVYQNPLDWMAAVHPEDIEKAISFLSIPPGADRTERVYRIRRPSGEIRWISSRGFPIRDKDGEPARIAGVSEDVTERKGAEEALRASEKTLRQVINLVPHMIFAKDREGRILLANRAFSSAYGKTVDQITNQLHEDIHPNHEEVQQFLQDDYFVFSNRQPTFIARETFTDVIGSVRIHQTTRIPFLMPPSEEMAVLGISIDITKQEEAERQQNKLEEQLRQSHKMEAIGQLAGGIAHDFNNLLTGIIGYCSLVLRKLDKDDPNYRNVNEIQKAGERASSLTRQLLAFSRKQILEPKILCLSDLIQSMEGMLRRMIGEDIEFTIGLDPKRGHIKADPAQITQIIMNLVVNARDAMPNGGRLHLEAQTIFLDEEYARDYVDVLPGPYVMLVVQDNGCGMDDSILKQIFEPFFTTKEQGKGTGLGLSTVYGIVKQSGGSIQVESVPNRGTVFYISLPWVEPSMLTRHTPAREPRSYSGTETILLVEDDEIVNQMSTHALQEYGYTVLNAFDAFEAYDRVERHGQPIHLLLTDVVLPKEGGRFIAEKLLASHPAIKVLYMSGYTNEAIVHHGILEEGISFLHKPFTVDDLVKKVREVLDQD